MDNIITVDFNYKSMVNFADNIKKLIAGKCKIIHQEEDDRNLYISVDSKHGEMEVYLDKTPSLVYNLHFKFSDTVFASTILGLDTRTGVVPFRMGFADIDKVESDKSALFAFEVIFNSFL